MFVCLPVRLVERGYAVEEQVETHGYRMDLVVVGADQRLAVECEGTTGTAFPTSTRATFIASATWSAPAGDSCVSAGRSSTPILDAALAPLLALLDAQGISPAPPIATA